MAGYYDLVLGLIPLALLGTTAALTVLGVSVMTAIPFGAAIAIGLMGHAMFVNAPVDSPATGAGRPNQPPVNAD